MLKENYKWSPKPIGSTNEIIFLIVIANSRRNHCSKRKPFFSQWSFSHDLFMISPCIYLSRVRISPFKENYGWSTKPIESTNEIEWNFFGFIVFTQIHFHLECVLKELKLNNEENVPPSSLLSNLEIWNLWNTHKV